ncbi:unnamed protein product [Rotaria sp. Silwood1]|nr:unnamed protein product [Rotaria sp. Silwood1]
MRDRNSFLTAFELDNKGNFLFFKATGTVNNDNITQLVLINKQADSTSFKYVNLKQIGNIFLDEVKMKADNLTNKFIITSFYGVKRRGDIQGLYISVFDANTNIETVSTIAAFDGDFRNDAKGDAGVKQAFNDYFIKQIIPKKNGGFLFSAESEYSSSRGGDNYNRWDYVNPYNSYGSGGFYSFGSPSYYPWSRGYNSYNITKYFCDNIAIACFDSTGKIEWNNVIRKSQFDDNSDVYLGYGMFNAGNQLKFLFNQLERGDQILTEQSISPDGQITRSSTLKNLDKGYIFMPRHAKQVGAKQIIVPFAFFALVICTVLIHFHIFYVPVTLSANSNTGIFNLLVQRYLIKLPPIFITIVFILLILLQSIRLSIVLNNSKMYAHQGFTAAFAYVFLSGLLPNAYLFSPAFLVNSFIILLFSIIVKFYNNQNAKGLLFNAGFLASSIVICYYPSVVLLLVTLCGLAILRPFRMAECIIIPARNEENNIAKCLNTIVAQNYPKELFEVIVINDHSTDKTLEIIEDFANRFQNIKLINLKDELLNKPLNAYKKKAIEIAINKANGNWIVTTDADCEVQQNWLLHFDDYIEHTNSLFVAAPVIFSNNKTIVSQFQYIDFMALQAATAATVSVSLHCMCNGANLAYEKNTFFEVGGFKGIDNIASGDDMLLMNKIKLKHKDKIGYLFCKESIVTTLPMPTWKSFINQRIRWASKADKYDDKSLLPVLLMVYLFNLSLVTMFFWGVINSKILLCFFVFFLIKTLVEWTFIKPASLFFGKIRLLQFTLLQPLHIIYIVVAGWLGKFGTYKWKDRKVQ